jgi:ankyrin repeat protein
MVSKTGMLSLVKASRWNDVDAGLRENPDLLAFRDERGRNWLHVCCATKAPGPKVKDSIRTAEVLLAHGLDLDREAFTEGTWKATPLWFAISRGRNLALAEYLLKRGCNPNHCLFAAAFHDDVPAIRLLTRHGADVNQSALDETPFLGAIKTSHFGPAKVLLELGADPNYRDRRGMTALHYMLKKGSDRQHFAMLLAHGARGDIGNAEGVTAIDLLSRKKDPVFRRMAEKLSVGQ